MKIPIKTLVPIFLIHFVNLHAELYRDFEYEVYDSKIRIIKYHGSDIDLTVPPVIKDIPVVIIGTRAFSGCNSVTISLPDSIELIEDKAFVFCSNLISINPGSGLKSSGESAFYNCSNLTNVSLPGYVMTIGEKAFANCRSLSSVKLDPRLKEIGQMAFYNRSSLPEIAIPEKCRNDWLECISRVFEVNKYYRCDR